MKILQLCCISNQFSEHDVESWDIKHGKDILDMPDDYGKNFDFVFSAPPCDQFTKANALNWKRKPDNFIAVAKKCFDVSIQSGKIWLLENPPGRIEKFIPDLRLYRIATWHGIVTNKEYIIYSNHIFLLPYIERYGKPGTINNWSKEKRENWQSDFINDIKLNLQL